MDDKTITQTIFSYSEMFFSFLSVASQWSKQKKKTIANFLEQLSSRIISIWIMQPEIILIDCY